MTTYEQDPDVVRWGLQLFDSDPYSNYGCCSSISQSDMGGYYQEQYSKEDHYDIACNNAEEEELISYAIQESLSQLAVEEEPSSSLQVPDDEHVSIYSQEWLGQSMRNHGHENSIEDGDDIGCSTACSSPEEVPYCEDWSYSLELTDEYAVDGEVGKRLNQMVPIPHVPRINGEIPSLDEATLDHQRLLERLQVYQLVELKVQGDGNCQFRSLSDQFYRTTEHHNFVREEIVNQLKKNPKIYEGYVPMAYGDYMEKMSKSGEWGDHVTLQAAADSYGVKIFVITSFKDTCYIEIIPNVQRSNRVICLSFWAEVHYNSIYFEGEVPIFETKKKKRWLSSRRKQLELAENNQ